MAAPEYVPGPVAEQPRVYHSPPRRPDSWTNNRPGDFNGPQPGGPGLGSPGPDQGYALKLARQFEGRLTLTDGEHEADAMEGCLTVALKRASIFGRAPMVHDLTVAFAVWGYLGEGDDDLIAFRKPIFEEVSHPHHYLERRAIADAVPEAVLRLTPAQVRLEVANNWRSLIQIPDTPVPAATHAPAPAAVASVPVVDQPIVDQPIVHDVVVEPVAVEPAAIEDHPTPVVEPTSPPSSPPEPSPATPPEPVAAAPALPTRVVEPPVAPSEPHAADDVETDWAQVEGPLPTAAEPDAAIEVDATVEPDAEVEPLEPVAEEPEEVTPAKRMPVKPVPLDPSEVAKLARQAKVAFQKQSHHPPKPPDPEH